MKTITIMLIIILAITCSLAYFFVFSYLIETLWNWIMVYFGIKPITFGIACGINLLSSTLLGSRIYFKRNRS